MSRVVTESRPYDQFFDATYTTSAYRSDPRVAAAMSRPEAVSGSGRYSYFRRPIMPRMTAVPPQVLLAPTETIDPLAPVEEIEELPVKNQEVQTQYRDSESQTNPYTPDFFVKDGTEPEVLLLKDMTFGNGLPVGKKEVMMIEQARSKRELETNLPPFTDEAGLILRKRLMEAQEMKEFHMRESEIDQKRQARLEAIDMALKDHDESNEFLAAQRVEGLRQIRMEEREKTLLKIRDKRIKVLRRLAHRRNQVDPRLSTSEGPDPINHYFDKGSHVYAPIKRSGPVPDSDPAKFDVLSRTAPLTNMENISQLETNLPAVLSSTSGADIVSNMSKTAPSDGRNKGPRAAEPRLTSAAIRSLRARKRDIEVMTRILTMRKLERTGAIRPDSHPGSAPGMTGGAASAGARLTSIMPKGRPASPDFTQNPHDIADEQVPLQAACVLLQRLLRGRAVQNTMFEGRYRRRELITELRAASEMQELEAAEAAFGSNEMHSKIAAEEAQMKHDDIVKTTTVDAIAGSNSSNLLYGLVQEKARNESMIDLQNRSAAIHEDRRKAETFEGGRRQKMQMKLPSATAPVPVDTEGDANLEAEENKVELKMEAEIRADRFLLDSRYTKPTKDEVGGAEATVTEGEAKS